ncbi:ABC transporter B family member 21-like [Phoenix dactylifera]|uniref:ABC transporter B family member 21-like n=1 Tax=Phoenix dactylifera TaxID=42345 RepID=A0A8B8ZMF8_PHODC|nr:ABC transporter B family member 21-like [Phoenix dactylifera]
MTKGEMEMPNPSVDATSKGVEIEKDVADTIKLQDSDEKKNSVPYYKLFSFADTADLVLMVTGSVAAAANGISLPLMTVLFGELINILGKTTDVHIVVHEISKVALKFIYLGVANGVASCLQVACWTTTGEKQAARIRNLYLKAILGQDISFFDKEANTGELIGKISGDTYLIQDAMGEKVGKFIQLVSSFIGGFIVAFFKGWQLTLVMLSVIPLVVLAAAVMAIAITKMAANAQTAYSVAAATVEQTIGSIRTVASFTGEKQAVEKYNRSLKSVYKASVLEGLAAGFGLGATIGIIICSYGLGVWFGSNMIQKKDYTGGDVINVIFAVVTGSMSLGQASPCSSAFAAGKVAAFKMFEIFNRKPEIDAYDTTGKILDDIIGNLELRDVCFSYPARPDEQIFTGLSLIIPSGTTVALVGESGSGKSTVISLIERFYDPQAGEVLIDGINIKEFQLRWIRGKIGLVSQEPVLFASSIRNNITYGKDDATIEEIRAALELANASKFIDRLPEGIDTLVGEHGTQLSGGQKQRVAIARAILKNPRILLLDEATSALDAESEQMVQEALDKVMSNRTTVIVAHRLSTVRKADMITVLHHGSIVEKGSHDQLIKNPDGPYSRLTQLQDVNQDSEQNSLPDQGNLSVAVNLRKRSSSWRSTSSSGASRSRHSFSESFRLPAGPDIQEITQKKPSHGESPQHHQEVPLSRLAYLNKPELPVVLLGVIAAVVSGVVLPIFGVLLSSIIHTFYGPPANLRKDSRFWSLMFVVLGLVTVVSIPARAYFFAVAGSRLIQRIRSMSFGKVVNMEIGWFDKSENSSGAIGARLSADAAAVRSLVGDALGLITQNATTFIAGLVIAVAACWQLALLIVALVPVITVNGWIQMKLMKGLDADLKVKYEEASQVASDAVGSIRTVASFTAEDKVLELYQKKCEGPKNIVTRQGLISGVGFGLSYFFLFCVYATSFYVGARLIEDGKTTSTDIFKVFFVLNFAAVGISQSSFLAPDARKAKSATASVFAILDQKSRIDPSDDSGMTIQLVKGNIEFQHVSFRYPTRPDVQIFKDLCLAVQSGKTVALVGESGSGKSTVVSLLQRFYDPDSGQILLDGFEIQKLQLRWLRQQMGLVSQEPVLFDDTIRANIAYGKGGEPTEAEILAAAESANAHQFISALQQGYDTTVGERGVQLSGGQKQRVAIARAIIKDPKILLLDEATSALDAESERVVQDALDRMMLNQTTIVIAHRLSTIRGADIIAVVKNGVIIEKGDHEALIGIKNGAYASLVSLHKC